MSVGATIPVMHLLVELCEFFPPCVTTVSWPSARRWERGSLAHVAAADGALLPARRYTHRRHGYLRPGLPTHGVPKYVPGPGRYPRDVIVSRDVTDDVITRVMGWMDAISSQRPLGERNWKPEPPKTAELRIQRETGPPDPKISKTGENWSYGFQGWTFFKSFLWPKSRPCSEGVIWSEVANWFLSSQLQWCFWPDQLANWFCFQCVSSWSGNPMYRKWFCDLHVSSVESMSYNWQEMHGSFVQNAKQSGWAWVGHQKFQNFVWSFVGNKFDPQSCLWDFGRLVEIIQNCQKGTQTTEYHVQRKQTTQFPSCTRLWASPWSVNTPITM